MLLPDVSWMLQYGVWGCHTFPTRPCLLYCIDRNLGLDGRMKAHGVKVVIVDNLWQNASLHSCQHVSRAAVEVGGPKVAR